MALPREPTARLTQTQHLCHCFSFKHSQASLRAGVKSGKAVLLTGAGFVSMGQSDKYWHQLPTASVMMKS